MEDFLLLKSLGRQEFDNSLLSHGLVREGYAAPAKKAHDLMKAGVILGIKRGFYVLAPKYASEPLCKETLANLIYGPSYISLESALAHYGLIPEAVPQVTSVTSKRDKHFETPVGIFTYRFLNKDKYREGIDLVWIDAKHPVLMASPEKALCDYVVLKAIKLDSAAEAGLFLSQDLRVDADRCLNLIKLHQLNRVYKSPSVDQVLAFLERQSS